MGLIVHEPESSEVGGTLTINLRRNGHVVMSENDILGLRDPLLEQRRRDGALVDIEEGHVVVGRLVKKNDELDEIGVRLLPEWFLAATEEIVQERGDVVRQGVSVQVAVKRVVAILGIEADFDVILSPAVPGENLFYLAAKIPFDFEG